MIILTIRTDKPKAEVGLYKNSVRLIYTTYEAHRILAETIHLKIEQILKDQALSWNQIEAIVCYKGPGSFTGLRIGLSLANALSGSLLVSIVGTTGDNWIGSGIDKLLSAENEKLIVPEYGAEPHITIQKK
jgi:tRNA threonylcarbamoyladenosine biosynthesis protein TsaB